MGRKKHHQHARPAPRPQSAAGVSAGTAEPLERMRRKEYETELRRLQVELVSLQEWVKKSGARICIVFEGRDTAGKGGTIKALT